MLRATLTKKLLKVILPLLVIPTLLLTAFYYAYLTHSLKNETVALSKSLLLEVHNHIEEHYAPPNEWHQHMQIENTNSLPYIFILDKNMELVPDERGILNKRYYMYKGQIEEYVEDSLRANDNNLKIYEDKKFMIKPLINKNNELFGFSICHYENIYEKKLAIVNQTFIYILLIIIFITFIDIILTILFSFTIVHPITLLIEGTKRVMDGDLSYQIDISSDDEVGVLVDSFNSMTKKRRVIENEIKELNQNLELKVEEALHTLNSVINNTSNLIFYKDSNFNYMGCNDAFKEFIGYSREKLMGHNDYEFFPEELALRLREQDKEVLEGAVKYNHRWVTYPDGKKVFLHMTSAPFYDKNGNIMGIVGNAVDLTKEKLLSDELERQAKYDSLTNIPNRVLFMDRLNQSIKQAHRNKTNVVVFFIDLDKFKAINDTLGHRYGDLILKNVAKILSESIRESDTVARLGGDEFAMIIHDAKDEATITALAQKLITAIDKPMFIEGQSMHVTLSIGISSQEGALSAEELLNSADHAMYLAKKNGKNCFIFKES